VLGYPKLFGRDNRSASQILDKRDAPFSRERSEVRRRRRFYKAAHEEIAAMNSRIRAVFGPTASSNQRASIRGADLLQFSAGRFDNFTDTKAPPI
jgi:hypothetical protein